MHPRITELLAYVDRHSENLQAAFESVPVKHRMLRPTADRWSPAEVVHHVVIVERAVVWQLRALVAQAQALRPETEERSLFPIAVATRVELRTGRARSPEYAIPTNTDCERIWAEYLETRRTLKDVIAAGDGLALGAVSAPHMRLGDLTAYEWIAFAGAHAARHADQIREMTVSLA